MIIYNDVAKAAQTKREIKTLIEHLNRHLADFNNSGFPPVKTEKDLKIFAQNPEKYFLDQAEKQAKNRNMEGSDPAEYARLFGHSFAPDLKSYPIGDLTLLDYLRLAHGEVVSVEDIEQRLEDSSIIKTQTPEEEAAARLLSSTPNSYESL